MNTPVSILTMVFKPHSKRKPMEKNRETSQYVMVHATTTPVNKRQFPENINMSGKLNYGNTYDKKHSKAPK